MFNLLVLLFGIAFVVACMVFALWLRKKLNFIYKMVGECRDELATVRLEVKAGAAAAINATSLGSLDFDFPVVLGGPSIDGQHARTLFHVLVSNKPQTILELGSGSSTMLIAKTLKKMGCIPRIHISVDHEEKYLNITREVAKLNSLDTQIQFEYCPLESLEGYDNKWYSNIRNLIEGKTFDLIVVDGPPAYEEGMGRAREPALDVFASHISPGGILILDDANRIGESAVSDAWLAKHKQFSRAIYKEGTGIAVFTKSMTK